MSFPVIKLYMYQENLCKNNNDDILSFSFPFPLITQSDNFLGILGGVLLIKSWDFIEGNHSILKLYVSNSDLHVNRL